MSLITGALPAQYGFQTAGVIDITLKSGTTDPGAEATMTGGTHDWLQPAFAYGGRSARSTTSRPASSCTTPSASRTRPRRSHPRRHRPVAWAGKVTGIIDEQTSAASFIAGGSKRVSRSPTIPARAWLHGRRRDRLRQRPCSTSGSGRAPISACVAAEAPTRSTSSFRDSRAIPTSPTSPTRSAT